ncbi:hypothetical protein GH714_031081 [Hevea brasiliensis]|uniref:PRA1 family protein n=1 Tax=Hevea brasiliensis TaxID=3981 RepID=A0A6A6LKJ8_HEVBR|nr:hypothetical protein GH714_031081 [Hevea brasiliensis]
MTTYGTIPTASSPGATTTSSTYLELKKGSKKEALVRLKTNAAYFGMNYAIIILIILFLSLLWHPISLIVFIVMMAAWLFLYFLRDEPLEVFGRTIDDLVVLILLGVLTIVFLLLTHVTLNVIVSLVIGVVAVVVHGVIRKIDDLFLDEEATGLMSTASGGGAASSSS